MTSARLRDLSVKYLGWASLFGCLLAIGALALGYTASAEEVCSAGAFTASCDTEIDGATFAIVAAGYFVAGLVVVIPIAGIGHLMSGMAEFLAKIEDVDAATGEPDDGITPT